MRTLLTQPKNDLDTTENQASSPSLEQSNDNETAPTFSPLESFGINANNIYESGASYSENNIISQSQNSEETEASTLLMPKPIDLSASGLRRSKRIAELKRKGMKPTHETPSRKSIVACLAMFGLFCSIATSINSVATTQVNNATKAYTSLLSQATESYHRANSLVDGTINCFSTAALSAAATNEVFTFKEAMMQDDNKDFVKAMLSEIHSHEDGKHWTMTERSKMPPGTKTVMSVWSFKRKRFPNGS